MIYTSSVDSAGAPESATTFRPAVELEVKLNSEATPSSSELGCIVQLKTRGCAKSIAAHRLEAVFDYMVAHLDEPMSIAALSRTAGLSESRFFELFKQVTRETPLKWIIQARMRCAIELLERTNLQVKDIAGRLGYEDQFYFSRRFKSVLGVAPSQYRAQKLTLHRPPGCSP